MEFTERQEAAIKKLKKLFALKESSNEHEAALAAARAAELMAEHELDEATIRVTEGGEAEPLVNEGIMDGKNAKTGKRDIWKGYLVQAVAVGFGCRVWWNNAELTLFGRPSNIGAAKYLIMFLTLEIERLAQEKWAQQVPRPLAAAAVAWRNSFKVGASSEIRRRMELKRNATLATPTVPHDAKSARSQALVLVRKDQEELEAGYKKMAKVHNLRSTGGTSVKNLSAHAQGRAAASRINLEGGRGLNAPAKRIKE